MKNIQGDVSMSQTEELDLFLASLRGANLLTPYVSIV